MMWPVFPHGLGLRDSFPVSFKWFLALKPPPCQFSPLSWRSWAFRRPPSQGWWWCTTLHCLLSYPGGWFPVWGRGSSNKKTLRNPNVVSTSRQPGLAQVQQRPGELLKEQLLHSFPVDDSHHMCPLLYLMFFFFFRLLQSNITIF